MLRHPKSYIALFLVLVCLVGGCVNSGRLSGDMYVRQLFSEGLAYEALSEYTAALDRYTKITKNYTAESSSWVNRAHLRMARIYRNNLNQPDQAIDNYTAFLKRTDGGTTVTAVRFELARVYRDQNSYDRAAEVYRTIINGSSKSQNVEEGYYYLGEVYHDAGNYDQSIETYRKFLDQFSDGDLADGALFNMAKAYSASDQKERQLETYRQLLTSYPDSDLREYTYLKAIQTASDLGRQSVSLELAQGYLADYGRGQYWDEINTLLSQTFDVNPETLSADKLSLFPRLTTGFVLRT